MSTRAVLVAALITGFVLGTAGVRSQHSAPSHHVPPVVTVRR
ncbi:hypothetical protein [Streptomyces sp. SPB162]|nr:hypothetical protein [Streptomyces sp. SPB162]MDF9811912.1 hypothetical protein [Streptomyces sp. SPB162]